MVDENFGSAMKSKSLVDISRRSTDGGTKLRGNYDAGSYSPSRTSLLGGTRRLGDGEKE